MIIDSNAVRPTENLNGNFDASTLKRRNSNVLKTISRLFQLEIRDFECNPIPF